MLDDLWAAIDPTDPERWCRVRVWGRSGVLLAAITMVGLPGAILLDLLLLVLRGDRDLLLSLRHAVEMMVVIWVIAPPLGVAAGAILWQRGERRRGDTGGSGLDAGTFVTEDT